MILNIRCPRCSLHHNIDPFFFSIVYCFMRRTQFNAKHYNIKSVDFGRGGTNPHTFLMKLIEDQVLARSPPVKVSFKKMYMLRFQVYTHRLQWHGETHYDHECHQQIAEECNEIGTFSQLPSGRYLQTGLSIQTVCTD